MGSRSVNISFTPGENEQIETIIRVPEEHRSIIHGVVKNSCNKVVCDAVVKLYECVIHHDEQILKPLTHTFTDECGQFVFGPLWSCKNYVIKVWINDVKIRDLIVHSDECDYDNDKQRQNKPMSHCEFNTEQEHIAKLSDSIEESTSSEDNLNIIDD